MKAAIISGGVIGGGWLARLVGRAISIVERVFAMSVAPLEGDTRVELVRRELR